MEKLPAHCKIMLRQNNGRFFSWHTVIKYLILAVVAALFVFWLFNSSFTVENPVTNEVSAEETVEALYGKKIDELKADVMARLEKCESGGAEEPDALIVFDSNKKPSIGRFQFQLPTIIHFKQVLDGQEIGRLDALKIATDQKLATDLATRIIFDKIGGIWEWENCAKKENLAPRIEIIRELEE